MRKQANKREKPGPHLSVHHNNLNIRGELVGALEFVGQGDQQPANGEEIPLLNAQDGLVVQRNAAFGVQEFANGHKVAILALLRHNSNSQVNNLLAHKVL